MSTSLPRHPLINSRHFAGKNDLLQMLEPSLNHDDQEFGNIIHNPRWFPAIRGKLELTFDRRESGRVGNWLSINLFSPEDGWLLPDRMGTKNPGAAGPSLERQG